MVQSPRQRPARPARQQEGEGLLRTTTCVRHASRFLLLHSLDSASAVASRPPPPLASAAGAPHRQFCGDFHGALVRPRRLRAVGCLGEA